MRIPPLVLLAIGIAVLIGIAVFLIVFHDQGSGEVLPVERFQENPENFIGNTYRLDGRITRMLGNREGVGRLFLVNTENRDQRVPLFVPTGVGGNVETGATYRFQLKVRHERDMTILEVQSMRKQ